MIFRYTRLQAIEDGVLVDLTPWAREIGFVYPVACTAALWSGYVLPQVSLTEAGQSERGRAHDVLFVLRSLIANAPAGTVCDRLKFKVNFLMPSGRQQVVELVAVCSPGDTSEPVITIMLPGED